MQNVIRKANKACLSHQRCAVAAPARVWSSSQMAHGAGQRSAYKQQLRFAPAQLQQQLLRRRAVAAAASNDDEAVERMKREIEKGDIWESEVVSVAVKVALVAAVIAAAVVIFDLGRPIVDNTLQSFPSPEQIQAYEDSK